MSWNVKCHEMSNVMKCQMSWNVKRRGEGEGRGGGSTQAVSLTAFSQFLLDRGPIYGSGCHSATCIDLTDVTLADEDTNTILTDNANKTIQGYVAMSVTQHGGQLCKQWKWCHPMTTFLTNPSCAIWWPNLQLMQVKPSGVFLLFLIVSHSFSFFFILFMVFSWFSKFP